MSGTVTPNFRLQKPPFDDIPWDQAVNGNMDIIDAALGQYLTITNFVGVWANAHAYATGQTTIDAQDSTFWRCLVAHTSSASPTTFAQDRAATTGRWAPTVPSGTNNAGSGNAGRNFVRNSMMNVNQRGAGPFSNSVAGAAYTEKYTSDGWKLATIRDTASVQLITAPDSARAQTGDEATGTLLQISYTGVSTSDAFSVLVHPIEYVRLLSGKIVTVSFWAGAATAGTQINLFFFQHFGTGGSPSPTVQLSGQTITLTTTLTRYSLTVTLPSAAGKTFGTNNNNYTGVQFTFSAGGTTNNFVHSGTVNLWGVQVEIGSAATPLDKPSYQLQIAECQRYYTTFNQLLCSTGYVPNAGIAAYVDIAHPVCMRSDTIAAAFNNIIYNNSHGLAVNALTQTNSRFSILVDAQGPAYAIFDVTLSAEL